MLTATYSLIAIATEQDRARNLHYKFQQYVQTAWKGLHGIDFPFLETAFGKLARLDEYCRSRKLERYLMPVLRRVARESEGLIGELEALAAKCTGIVRQLGARVAALSVMQAASSSDILQSMETYCGYLHARFEKEEKVLLPMARRLLTVEDWFGIAANFLSTDDAAPRSRRTSSLPFTIERRASSRSGAR